MKIAYTIEQGYPSDEVDEYNIEIKRDSVDTIESLNPTIINHIVDGFNDVLHDAACYDSFEELCCAYWGRMSGAPLRILYDTVFKVYYFDGEWIEWELTDDIKSEILSMLNDRR